MRRKLGLLLVLGTVALILLVWNLSAADPSRPTAPAPRGTDPVDRATDEPLPGGNPR